MQGQLEKDYVNYLPKDGQQDNFYLLSTKARKIETKLLLNSKKTGKLSKLVEKLIKSMHQYFLLKILHKFLLYIQKLILFSMSFSKGTEKLVFLGLFQSCYKKRLKFSTRRFIKLFILYLKAFWEQN